MVDIRNCQHCADRNDGFYGSYAPDCPYHFPNGDDRPPPPKPYKCKPVDQLAVGDWTCSGGTKNAHEVREPTEVINISGDFVRVMREGGHHRTRFMRNIRFVFATKAEAEAFYAEAATAWKAYEDGVAKLRERLMKVYSDAEINDDRKANLQ